MIAYNFKDIETKWQKLWEERKSNAAPTPTKERPPYFLLVMFPYPSGKLHMGHVRNYTIGDILARFHRRRGRSVLHPIGWDSFGLPAENAAIERGIDPGKWTWDNIAHMRGQLKQLAISYDWDREVATCDPAYYRWNQWFFIKMMEKGLVYRKKAAVNWCPKDATVLANEQVHDGKCWRCHTLVEQKELEQWFFKITQYAGELLKGHDELKKTATQKGWPDEVLTMQRNWIGQSTGAHVDFSLESGEKIRVFTTRPDTLFGATFMVLAPEHPLVDKITMPDRKIPVAKYKEQAKKLSKFDRSAANREKTGEFTGSVAINPVNGQRIPIWIADYVLTDYGTGAIMAVPAHDERDFAFAQKYKIPIVQVIQPADRKLTLPLKEAYTDDGVLVNSGSFDGLPTDEAQKKIAAELEKKKLGQATTTYKLRDWLLSRQRYWGTPIPVVYCPKCGMKPVSLDQLPVKLPTDIKFTGQGASPLTQADNWINTTCPSCKGPAKRDTDTMDTFVDSSWYYLRYTDAKNEHLPFDKKAADTWVPVHQYVGGIEHACMHLIYSRFFHKVIRDMGMVSSNEPFSSLLTQGMVTLGGTAMSKSRGNVVDPTDVISKYGTDSCRLFILFAAPPTQQLEWSDSQVGGVWRFVNRVWKLAVGETIKGQSENGDRMSAEDLERQRNVTIARVTKDIETDFGFNTAISAIMELVNALYLYPTLDDKIAQKAIDTVLELLFPFAPHITEELWELRGHKTPLSEAPWPAADESKMAASELEIVIQINGKVKDKIRIPSSATEDQVKTLAQKKLEEKGGPMAPKRVIYVPHKLVNFVGQ
jgi:leucyl-tRNA synthetase